ncbi:chorismate synthase [Cuneatibacter sp. NSJ-177]|uniref:chorismate synthase n=1 Tax=Cuneatibacter sp. NSJ-177 TaxID=2931401 RepID=UPI001FD30743|nr:chorismate synthase [Cuneatibacter sp. NSJ-177]MCJ7837432.1 chorismate synthase [Cuneatibacter sp. NSJ-177]
MSGSTLGRIFTVTTWGESHGKAIGVVIDGCPAGVPLEEEDIQKLLDRRKPGQNRFTTARKEGDLVEILSGTFEGKTTGTPISLIVRNQDQRSRDYSAISEIYRPGHADYTFDAKYGFRDYRGGGRSSGRETIGRVAAGAIAEKILGKLGIEVRAYAKKIGPYDASEKEAVEAYLNEKMSKMDSVGGIVECRVTGMPAGIGDPVFDKLDANLAKAVMSIGAVKGVEIGDGFGAALALGSENNDPFRVDGNGKIRKKTNHSGGILGGISDGSEIVLRAAFKPTASIAQVQESVNRSGENVEIQVKGRHDPVIVNRAVVVVESMVALTVLDGLLANMSATMDGIENFYR